MGTIVKRQHQNGDPDYLARICLKRDGKCQGWPWLERITQPAPRKPQRARDDAATG